MSEKQHLLLVAKLNSWAINVENIDRYDEDNIVIETFCPIYSRKTILTVVGSNLRNVDYTARLILNSHKTNIMRGDK